MGVGVNLGMEEDTDELEEEDKDDSPEFGVRYMLEKIGFEW